MLLIIDDDPELCSLLQAYLSNEGYQVELAHTGKQGLDMALQNPYQAIVLDIMLPGMNGIDVLTKLRQRSNTPVIMLTAKGDDLDRIIGLELGADDYLPKPCNPRELLARLRAVLRRSHVSAESASTVETKSVQLGLLQVDEARFEVYWGDNDLGLTKAEYQILCLLMRHHDEVLTKEFLYEHALGRPFEAYDRSLDMHISNIRKKLAKFCAEEVLINIRGVGYRIDSPSS